MAMDKVVISILGRDRPGIVASVAEILLDKGCNIEDVTQTSLQAEFAGIFIATIPDSLAPSTLLSFLKSGLAPLGLEVLVKKARARA
jgi:glycine cleavage system transcriptional repressor